MATGVLAVDRWLFAGPYNLAVVGACLQRDIGPSRATATIVTLNLFQGLYKLWLNILQMLNQVQHDGCMEGWGFDCVLEKALS